MSRLKLLLLLYSVITLKGAVTSHVIMGPTKPAKCSPKTGDVWVQTGGTLSAPTGILYFCDSPNHWQQTNTGLQGIQGIPGTPGNPGNNGTNGTNGTNGAISVIKNQGTPLTVRPNLNFIGTPVTCVDNSGTTTTDCTFIGGSGGLADPGSNGIIKRTSLNVTAPAVAGTDYQSAITGGTQDQLVNGLFSLTNLINCTSTGGVYQYNIGSHAFVCHILVAGDIPTLNQSTTGNAATATVLASTPSLCSTGQAPTGILPNGNATGCAAIGGGGGGIVSMVTGAVDPGSTSCSVPSSGNFQLYFNTVLVTVWECVGTNTWQKILAVSGSGPYIVTGSTSTAPSAPASGNVSCYFDSTTNTQICEDSSGNFFTMVKGASSVSNQFVTNIDTSGIQHLVQPTPTNVGLSNVTNDVQTKATVVPNTLPTQGQGLIGNSGGTAYNLFSLAGSIPWLCKPASASGTAYTCTPTLLDGTAIPASLLSAPVAGQQIIFIPDITNTGSATLSIDGSTTKIIRKGQGVTTNNALSSGDMPGGGAGPVYILEFNGSSGAWFINGTPRITSNDGSLTVTGSINNPDFAISSTLRIITCQPGLGDGLNAISVGTYLMSECLNEFGNAWTITAIKCFTDNNGTSTLNVTNGAGTGLLTGAITCTNSFAAGTQSGTTTIASADFTKFTFVADGTSKQATFVITGTR